MKIALSGSTGLVGARLASFLAAAGHSVIPIKRVHQDTSSPSSVAWNPSSAYLDLKALEGLDAIIHLAGDNVASGRWTKAKKDRIRSSRVVGTRQLVRALTQLAQPPQHFFCASAVGVYGDAGATECDETSLAGDGFLASVCQDWEAEANRVAEIGIRPVLLRFGVILDPAGGALKRMLLPFRLGLGGRLGSGQQFLSWIAAPEIPPIIAFLLEQDNLSGPINMVAPSPLTNADFTATLAKHLRRPAIIPVPAIIIRLLMGEMGQDMLLSSCRALPSKLLDAHYSFQFPTVSSYLASPKS